MRRPYRINELHGIEQQIILTKISKRSVENLILCFLHFIRTQFIQFLFQQRKEVYIRTVFSHKIHSFIFQRKNKIMPADHFLVLCRILFSYQFITFGQYPHIQWVARLHIKCITILKYRRGSTQHEIPFLLWGKRHLETTVFS